MFSKYTKGPIWTLVIGISLVLGFATTGEVYAGQSKVEVCHMEGNGAFHLITIAEPAFPAHIDHGDASPGDIVPGSGNQFSFAGDCTLIPACPCIVDLPSGWQALSGSAGESVEVCTDGSVATDSFGSWSDGSDVLSFSKNEQCDGPTEFTCSAGGNTRTISQAQYAVCKTTTSTP